MSRCKVISTPLLCIGALCFGAVCAEASSFSFQLGDIVAGTGNGKYKVFSPTGTLLTTLDTTSGASEDTGGAFDSHADLFVTNFARDSVSEFGVNGNLINAGFGSGYNAHPESITFNSAGDVFVGQADGTHHVLEFNSSGTLLNTFTPTPERRGTDWIDLAPDGKTLYYTSEGSSIKRFDISTGTQLADFADGLPGSTAYALRILPNGDVLVADTSEALLLDSSGHIIRTYTAPGLNAAFALNILPNGKSFLTGNINSAGEIFQFNIDTGALEQTISPNPEVDLAGLIVFGEIGIGPPPPPPTTTPEPMSFLLLGLGLGALVVVRRTKLKFIR